MKDTDVINAFEKYGKAAEFLLGVGRPASRDSAQKRISAAVALYLNHPHLQDRLHDTAFGFKRWSLMAAIEQRSYLECSENQRGIRA